MMLDYLVGDVRDVLRTLPEGSVHTIVTSPPYLNLRDYGIPPSVWGGDPACEHEWGDEMVVKGQHPDRDHSNITMLDTRGEQGSKAARAPNASQGAWCQLCGAWRGCLGLEPTLEMYIEHLAIDVGREMWRVLRDDGTLWLNLGDCYASGSGGDRKIGEKDETRARARERAPGFKPKNLMMVPHRVAMRFQEDGWVVHSDNVWFKSNPMPESARKRPTNSHEYIFLISKAYKPTYWTHRDGPGTRKKPKADYRYLDLLNDVEHVERPDEFNTTDEVECPECGGAGELEGWFGFVGCENCGGKGKVRRWKRINLWNGHDYFYDADAVRESLQESTKARMAYKCITPEENPRPNSKWPDGDFRQHSFLYKTDINAGRNLRNVWDIPEDLIGIFMEWYKNQPPGFKDVWRIATQPYPAAHFATFPEKIPELCIKAGTSEWGCCPECGAPWERVVEVRDEYKEWAKTQRFYGEGGKGSAFRMAKTNDAVAPQRHDTKGFQPTCECIEEWKRSCGADSKGEYRGKAIKNYEGTGAENPSEVKARILKGMVPKRTVGFQPTCDCPEHLEPIPCTVLDPFAGSFTTGKVGRELGQKVIGIDISEEYRELAIERAMLNIPDIESYA